MNIKNGGIATLFLLATCSDGARDANPSSTAESSARGLGTIPPSESAAWQRVNASSTPDPRFLQAAAFDSARQVVVMFGGIDINPDSDTLNPPKRETWEWNTTTGKWTNRTDAGSAPAARSGAAMVYDSKRARFVLFGGRAGSGFGFADTWEWDSATGAWADVTSAGSHPPARCQAGMVYEASTGKILLFGGGRSDASSSDSGGVTTSDGDTWELDPATHVWTERKPAVFPSARHDFGLVWDATRNQAVLFGGMQVDIPGVPGIPKQDTWEWDPATATWTERTGTGSKPEPRYGHGMAFDGSRGKVVVFGGVGIDSGANVADVWDWDPVTGAWTKRMAGTERPMPTPRRYASLVSDDARGRLELLAGAADNPTLGEGAIAASMEVWELDPSKPGFTDRTSTGAPNPRLGQCMAYNPSTGKTYVFGGADAKGNLLDDLWAWDGKVWSKIAAEARPPARQDAAMAFDPARKSLVLFGGYTTSVAYLGAARDTWEWSPTSGWVELAPSASPDPLVGHGMVTDTARSKILLFGGSSPSDNWLITDSRRTEVWEWDGATQSWTNRTPASPSATPNAGESRLMAYDSGRGKLFAYDGGVFDTSLGPRMGAYWEWDSISAGWTMHDTGDSRGMYATAATYDSIRRREILLAQGPDADPAHPDNETWELDSRSQTLYVRSAASPGTGTMVFDSGRGVVVLFGGNGSDSSVAANETWEYRVTKLGNGEGCTAAFASSCASGSCVDGVCCEVSACTGPCKSCSVRGSEGKCVLAKAGTEVSGSCSNGQACDGSGNCKPSNGQPCTTASDCASGFCADGVCCDSACGGVCVACNQIGQVGTCAPFSAGTDPQHECGKGEGVCASACDGVSDCSFPRDNLSCGKCLGCDGMGTCSARDPFCYPGPGTGGSPSGAGGYPVGTGGIGGSSLASGGQPPGGAAGTATVSPDSGGSSDLGGSAGTTLSGDAAGVAAGGAATGGSGGVAGSALGAGGSAGTGGILGQGGATLSVGGSGGGLGGASDGGISGSGGSRDAGSDAVVRRSTPSGCSCALGHATGSDLSVPFLAVASAFGLLLRNRRQRRMSRIRAHRRLVSGGPEPGRPAMRTSNGAIAALFLLASCSEDTRDVDSPAPSFTAEPSARGLGTAPPSESAVWQKVGASSTPSPRFLQAAAFDSARHVLVMFGGTNPDGNTAVPNQETWEWNTVTGKWTNRTGAGSAPAARSGAAMAYDSKRARFILFGGRARGGLNYEDTWEWNPAAGLWTDVTNAGNHPSARSQAGMVYEASTGEILLFGGGRSDVASVDATGVLLSDGDTWELDPATYVWTLRKPTVAPSARHDLGLVWDSTRNRAVLFGGLQVDGSGATGVAKQDTWEWDPSTASWTERAGAGPKPGPRHGHAMAFDGSRGKLVAFGGFDATAGADVAEVWDWDPPTAAWTKRMTGAEVPMPTPRRYASLVSDDARARLELVAGSGSESSGGWAYEGLSGSKEVWELDPSKPAFTDRTAVLETPSARSSQCMAYNPSTGKTYVFGGSDEMTGALLDDLWAWDGAVWSQITTATAPSARNDSAMAFDPARKSLILFGGNDATRSTNAQNDTWEWRPDGGWTQLNPRTSPVPLTTHGMVTDTTRGKILLFGGISMTAGATLNRDPTRIEVWEWDGAAGTWTNRTPPSPIGMPEGWKSRLMAYDSGERKLFVYDGGVKYMIDSTRIGAYWDWDPISAGWAKHDTGDSSHSGFPIAAAYDSIRRREVFLARGYDSDPSYAESETWELDANSQTMFVRSVSSPSRWSGATMAFDSARGVVVLFGGRLDSGAALNETWEYGVTGLGNGEGCTAASASSCASGSCVDGVCCEAAACPGRCSSCNVRGSEGKCMQVTAGSQVPGSCADSQACDGKGNCMTGNGQPCTTASACASGFCADGVCCDRACDGVCEACNQIGQVGACAPYPAGVDPQHECDKGSGVCKSACSGVSNCGFPQGNVYCDGCFTCDGAGTCGVIDPYCYRSGGGYPGGTGGSGGGSDGGSGGSSYLLGGAGGSGGAIAALGGAGGAVTSAGGYTYVGDAAGGSSSSEGGASGSGNTGGYTGRSSPAASGGANAVGGSVSRGGATGRGGATAGSGGASSVASGGSPGQVATGAGGDGGDLDGGGPADAGVEARPNVHLSRSGCSCRLGRADSTSTGTAGHLVASLLVLFLVRPRPRRRCP